MSSTIARKADASDLPSTIARAIACLDEGDIKAAALLSRKAVDDAAANERYARQAKVGDALLGKARQLQSEALLIEVRVQTAIADMVDEGQAAGEIASKSQKKSDVQSSDISTLDDLGVDRRRLSEMRKLRDAEKKEPGIAERAIRARVEAGFAPTRAVVRGLGNQSASKDERGDDFYQTAPELIHALLCVEAFAPHVWEPSCGYGAIAGPMADAGYSVGLSDFVDRGHADKDGVIQSQADFLATNKHWPVERLGLPAGGFDIVTNPPFGIVNDYIAHALRVHQPRKMAMLLNLNAVCGADNDNRNFWMDICPPARIHVFTRRAPMMHREGYDGPRNGSQMNVGWFVWEQAAPDVPNIVGPYGNQTLLNRIDWRALSQVSIKKPEIDHA